MDTILLKPILHRQQECIGIYFSDVPILKEAVKKMQESRWTKTFKCWYVPLNRENYNLIESAFDKLAQLDTSVLKAYLVEKKKTINSCRESLPVITKELTARALALEQAGRLWPTSNHQKPVLIHAINAHILPKMSELIILKGYSPKTEKTYRSEMSQLLQLMGNKSADLLTPDMIKRYLVYCFEKLRLEENTLHSRINALYPVGLKIEA